MRGAHAAQKLDVYDRYYNCMFDAMWVEELALGSEYLFLQAFENGGLDGKAILELAKDTLIKQALMATTRNSRGN